VSEKLNGPAGGLGKIWHDPNENSAGRLCKIKGRCSDIESNNLFADFRDKGPLIFYWDGKFGWVREVYAGNMRSRITRFKVNTVQG
jgi:hypothetical protein